MTEDVYKVRDWRGRSVRECPPSVWQASVMTTRLPVRYVLPLICVAVYVVAGVLFGKWGVIGVSALWILVLTVELERGRSRNQT
jgi:hypothetical protein